VNQSCMVQRTSFYTISIFFGTKQFQNHTFSIPFFTLLCGTNERKREESFLHVQNIYIYICKHVYIYIYIYMYICIYIYITSISTTDQKHNRTSLPNTMLCWLRSYLRIFP
ncbi:hypothetical protein LOAG_02004, partial [Loa loa]